MPPSNERKVLKLFDYPHDAWHTLARHNKPDWPAEDIHEWWVVFCELPARKKPSD